jgi:hypothetical protein
LGNDFQFIYVCKKMGLMHTIKNVLNNKSSRSALLLLLTFFALLFCTVFSSSAVLSSSKLEKGRLTTVSSKATYSKFSKINTTTSKVEEDIEYNEIEIDPFVDFPIGIYSPTSLFKEFAAFPSKFFKSYFYKKSSLFLLFCKLKLHLV